MSQHPERARSKRLQKPKPQKPSEKPPNIHMSDSPNTSGDATGNNGGPPNERLFMDLPALPTEEVSMSMLYLQDIGQAGDLTEPYSAISKATEDTSHGLQSGHPIALPGGRSGSAPSGSIVLSTEPVPLTKQSTKDSADTHSPNIVIFGETGVGKSSVVNLIAGEKRAHTSNAALGCTFKHERHSIRVGETACTLWDTTGLDEGSEGTVPAYVAEKNLRALIGELAHTGGIHLVIYCIRGNRLTKALKHNYDLFYVAVCRRKVPVALVVTGLEHEPGDMDAWWTTNEKSLQRQGMLFDEHACITTLDVDNRAIQERQAKSRECLRELVLKYANLPPWKIKPSILSRISSTLRVVLMKTLSAGKPGDIKTTRKVIICDAVKNQPDPQVWLGITARPRRFNGVIGHKEYELLWMDKPAPETAPQYDEDTGLVLFYTSSLVDKAISPEDIATLRTLCESVGDACPVIVILRGCYEEETAHGLWNDVTSRYSEIRGGLTFITNPEDGQPNKLNGEIERLCIEHVEPRTGKRHSLWFWKQ